MNDLPTERPHVYLQAGGDRRVGRGHPWAYSNEIRMDAAAKALPPGALVTLLRMDGKPLGVGMFNPHPLIAVRMLARDARAAIDADFLARRLERALLLRERLFDGPWYRLVHAEADGLPGMVIDRYEDAVVLQVNTAGMDALTPSLLAAVDRVLAPACVVLRNDAPARTQEGLERTVEVVRGRVPEAGLTVRENGLAFPVDPVGGQKTGWFYDQRPNRTFAARLAAGGRMLDAYCYGGGFAVSAAATGAAAVVGVDSSDAALALARAAADRNGVAGICTFERGDAFAALEARAAARERFRLVVADPPAFAKVKKDLPTALRGYRKLARLAAAVVEPGGFLVIASCSHAVDAAAFADEVAAGIARAGRSGRILRAAGAGPDHPIHPLVPESAYLKSLTLNLD